MDGKKVPSEVGASVRGGSSSYRVPQQHCNAGGMLVPSGVIPPTFRDWLIPAVFKQAQSHFHSADAGKAEQLQHIRKMNFSFLLFVISCNVEEHEGGLM